MHHRGWYNTSIIYVVSGFVFLKEQLWVSDVSSHSFTFIIQVYETTNVWMFLKPLRTEGRKMPSSSEKLSSWNRATALVWNDLLSRLWFTSHLNANELHADYKRTLAQNFQGLPAEALGRAIWKDASSTNKGPLRSASVSWDRVHFPGHHVWVYILS